MPLGSQSRRGGVPCPTTSPHRLALAHDVDEPSPIEAVLDAIPPLLRGWLHLVCFFLSLPAGLLVIATAHTPLARKAAIVYAIGVSALFGVSALYHRRVWSVLLGPG